MQIPRNVFLASSFLVLFLLCVSAAQTAPLQLNNIQISGLRSTDSSLVLQHLGFRKGEIISDADTRKSIQNLWQLGLFSNIEIHAANQTAGSIDLIIKLSEYPRLSDWQISGNKAMETDDILLLTGIYRGMVLTPNKVYQARQALLRHYREKGYLLADVDFQTVEATDNRVLLNLDFTEGRKVQVERIRVFGKGSISNDDLKDAFSEIKEDRWWRGADFDDAKYQRDLDNLLTYCRNRGYRDTEILRDSLYYSDDKSDLFIDVYVDEGKPYYFGQISFSGHSLFDEATLRSHLLFDSGDAYNQDNFEASVRENLQNLYYNEGYLFTTVQPLEQPAGDSIHVDIRIQEGHPVTINEIRITGNVKTNEKVIRRELNIYPGDTFSRDKLEQSVRDVWVTNYFANVIPDVKLLADTDKAVDLEVQVEEKASDTANLSAGYAGDRGFIGTIGFTLNNFSLKHPFSGGDGQRLGFNWEFGSEYRNISLDFTEPWAFDTPTLIGFSLFDTHSNPVYQPFESSARGAAVRVGRQFGWPDRYVSGSWTLRMADNAVFDISDSSYQQIYGDRFDSRQISLSQTWRRDSRNRPEFPTNGSVLSLTTKFAGGPLQGDETFVKNTLDMEWYIPTPKSTVLYLNSKFGSIGGYNSESTINPNELFRMGGGGLGTATTLRGYDDGSVGPLNSTGTINGGFSLARFGAELRFAIANRPTVFGLVFAEAGNTWESFSATRLNDLKRSVGVGVRMHMPLLGIIGVDLGYGFDYRDSLGQRQGQWKFHFKFGQF